MSKPPAFQMYAADFDMDTGSWTAPQVGVYVRLLLSAWVNGSIPNNMAELARIARIDTRTLAKMWRQTLAKKWILTPENMYVNPRMELEREKQAIYRESQKIKGEKRSEQMWEGHIAVAKKRLQPKDSSSSSTSSSSSVKNKTYIECPVGVSQETWNAFIEMRKAMKAPLTAFSAKLIISNLTKLSNDNGNGMEMILQQSIANNWKGVFPLKEAGYGSGNFVGAGKPIEKAGRAKSDGTPYPVDAEC
jgi:uncharacterized protein YdaU (DUF1376 family)